jgi:hypothetical protein
VHQDRLSLIVGIVTHSDSACANVTGHLSQKAVAHPPGGLLESKSKVSSQAGHISPVDSERKTPRLSRSPREIGIGVGGVSSYAVVEVGNVEP